MNKNITLKELKIEIALGLWDGVKFSLWELSSVTSQIDVMHFLLDHNIYVVFNSNIPVMVWARLKLILARKYPRGESALNIDAPFIKTKNYTVPFTWQL